MSFLLVFSSRLFYPFPLAASGYTSLYVISSSGFVIMQQQVMKGFFLHLGHLQHPLHEHMNIYIYQLFSKTYVPTLAFKKFCANSVLFTTSICFSHSVIMFLNIWFFQKIHSIIFHNLLKSFYCCIQIERNKRVFFLNIAA